MDLDLLDQSSSLTSGRAPTGGRRTDYGSGFLRVQVQVSVDPGHIGSVGSWVPSRPPELFLPLLHRVPGAQTQAPGAGL